MASISIYFVGKIFSEFRLLASGWNAAMCQQHFNCIVTEPEKSQCGCKACGLGCKAVPSMSQLVQLIWILYLSQGGLKILQCHAMSCNVIIRNLNVIPLRGGSQDLAMSQNVITQGKSHASHSASHNLWHKKFGHSNWVVHSNVQCHFISM